MNSPATKPIGSKKHSKLTDKEKQADIANVAWLLYNEARGESYSTKGYVASIVYNRKKILNTKRYSTIVYDKKQFADTRYGAIPKDFGDQKYLVGSDGQSVQDCWTIAKKLVSGDFTPKTTATHLNSDKVLPKWFSDGMVDKVKKGNFTFGREKAFRRTPRVPDSYSNAVNTTVKMPVMPKLKKPPVVVPPMLQKPKVMAKKPKVVEKAKKPKGKPYTVEESKTIRRIEKKLRADGATDEELAIMFDEELLRDDNNGVGKPNNTTAEGAMSGQSGGVLHSDAGRRVLRRGTSQDGLLDRTPREATGEAGREDGKVQRQAGGGSPTG